MKLFLLGVCISMAALAQDFEKITQHKLFNGDELFEYRLKNGFQVLFVPRHQAKVLTYQVWFRVGSLQEKLDSKLKKTGLAHLFEHMMFRGSEKYPDGKFDEITARLGSDKQNATTYFYRTNYYESVPSAQLERIMELESDRMANLKLTKDLLDKEKGAVVGELRRALDNPNRQAWDELLRQMFPTAPFRYTVLGTEEEIKGFTIEEGNYFYRTHYAPNNATLIVIGDTTEKELMGLVTKYYGGMKSQQIPKNTIPQEPQQKKERVFDGTHKQLTSEIMMVGYHTSNVNSADQVAFSLLEAHLSKGMEARLRKLLVDTGIAVGAGAGTSSQPDIFELSVQLVEGKKAEQALKVIDKEIASLKTKLLDKDSFERARNQSLLDLYSGISDNSALGNWLGEYLMVSGNYLRGFEIVEGLKKLKAADVQKVAKEYFSVGNRSVVILRPPKTTSAIKSKAKKG